jgi:hypothetical protein
MDSLMEEFKEALWVYLEEKKADREQMEVESKTGIEGAKAMDLEANPEEVKAIAERQKVRKNEAAVEAIGALED